MPRPVGPRTLGALEAAFEAGDAPRLVRGVLALARAGHADVLRLLSDHPFYDDWLDAVHAGAASYFEEARGRLYVVGNPSQNGFYKLGKTRLSALERLAALNNEAVVGTFVLVADYPVHDRHFLERAAHRALSHLPRHKEFVHGRWQELCAAIESVVSLDRERLRQAGLWSAVPDESLRAGPGGPVMRPPGG